MQVVLGVLVLVIAAAGYWGTGIAVREARNRQASTWQCATAGLARRWQPETAKTVGYRGLDV
jgi:hypothetical protein